MKFKSYMEYNKYVRSRRAEGLAWWLFSLKVGCGCYDSRMPLKMQFFEKKLPPSPLLIPLAPEPPHVTDIVIHRGLLEVPKKLLHIKFLPRPKRKKTF